MDDPVFIILYMEKIHYSRANFSDFIIGDTYALITDYGRNQIIEYCINDGQQDNHFIKFGEVREDDQLKANSFKEFSSIKYAEPKEGQLHNTTKVKTTNFFGNNDTEEIHKPQGICSGGNYVFISSMNCIQIISKGIREFNLTKTIPLTRIPEKITVMDDKKIFVITSLNFDDTNECNENKKTEEIPIDEAPASNNLKNYINTRLNGNSLNNQNTSIGNNSSKHNSGANTDSDVASSFKYLFSSVVLTSCVLKHLNNEREKIREKIQLLTKWMIKISLEDSLPLPERIWTRICSIYRMLINFKYTYHLSNSESHISMNLPPISAPKKEESLGSIVFINSEFKFSYEKPNQPFSFGIICEQSESQIIRWPTVTFWLPIFFTIFFHFLHYNLAPIFFPLFVYFFPNFPHFIFPYIGSKT